VAQKHNTTCAVWSLLHGILERCTSICLHECDLQHERAALCASHVCKLRVSLHTMYVQVACLIAHYVCASCVSHCTLCVCKLRVSLHTMYVQVACFIAHYVCASCVSHCILCVCKLRVSLHTRCVQDVCFIAHDVISAAPHSCR